MAESNFVDYVKICCRSGDGGKGSTHFERSKIDSKGGPDGGDGGRGGHVILRGDEQMWTLLPLKYRKHVKAGHGGPGGKSLSSGAYGEDIVLDVPLGTVAKDFETGEVLYEISEEGQIEVLLAGGRGGRGNDHFKSATNQAPTYAQPGEPGEERWIILELKILADVGLVGFPNAGKSTLLSSITAAKPKIGNYAFTTLVPNLGIVSYRGSKSFVMADIPGIIEDAHKGRGLGIRFLRHIERNSALLFMVEADAEDINEQYNVLLRELELYNPELLDKKRILAISKADMLDQELREMIESTITVDVPYIFISAVSQYNIDKLKDMLWAMINND